MADQPLTPKMQRFVLEYLKHHNATKAATAAGYSPKTARAQGHKLLNLPHVAAAIAAGNKEVAERTGIDADRLVAGIDVVANSDIADYMSWDAHGNISIVPSDQIPQDRRGAIMSIKQTRKVLKTRAEETYGDDEMEAASLEQVIETKLELKLHPKVPAQRLAAEITGILVQRHEHTGKDGAPIEVEQKSDIDLSALSDEELSTYVRIHRKALRSQGGGDGAGEPKPRGVGRGARKTRGRR